MEQKHEVAPMDDPLPHYRVIQKGPTHNIPVTDFDSLVTHHPRDNIRATLLNGVVVGGEPMRRHAMVDSEVEEVGVWTPQDSYGLTRDQVLVKKDFILEDSRLVIGARGARDVDVPSPLTGYVGKRNDAKGLVDIYDREGGQVIARIRHMRDIAVSEGDTIQYGQALGTQSNRATEHVHVHMEVDTRYYQQYENYLQDLSDGRLSIDPARRDQGIEARAVIDDGVIRIGESSELARIAQQRLNAEGYRDANGQALVEDGVYRLPMQAAVINYQNAQGLPATGNLDPATLQQLAPQMLPPQLNPELNPVNPERDGRLPGSRNGGYGGANDRPLSNDPLLPQAEAAIRRLDASLGKPYDGDSACMAASAACLARKQGLTGIDHIVLSAANDRGVAAGQNLIVVQGDLQSPGRQLASMRTDDAMRTPVADSVQQLNQLYAASLSAPSQDAQAQGRQTGRTA
ncbi:XVIPCD domain-containing protein [Lysobacter sp. Root667]|uniref:XVIPCD domain-containing protein n=1 Tax=Lysobacter sp. Root667 TaxID=1736581 RepID=UPI00138F18EE|nr:XVIPCD domain-containing protein [Lysobacter sp. Root667]